MYKRILYNLSNKINLKNYFYLFLLVLSGEIIFSLPFHLPRFFRPSFLIEYQINNTQMGTMFGIYGITAMASYFPGGWLADRVKSNYLLGVSLLLTALGGLYLYKGANYTELKFLYGFWGVTTILLFWGGLIRATRLWGEKNQGFAFGTLEAGRGLIAALCASLAFWIFIFFISNNSELNSLKNVVLFYTIMTFSTGIMMLLFFRQSNGEKTSKNSASYNDFIKVIKSKKTLYIAFVIFISYSCYKGTDIYALYLYDVLGYSEVKSSYYITNMSYTRPLAAIVAGIIADRFSPSKVIFYLFFILIITYAFLALISFNGFYSSLFIANIGITLIAIFSLRAVYFALLSDVNIPKKNTGVTVGIVSLIGFAPDVFFATLIGKIIDSDRSSIGYQNCFMFLLLLAAIGLVLVFFSYRFKK